MANKKVTLMRYCKTPAGWRRYPAFVGKNGRVRPGFATVNGKAQHCPEGHYEARFYTGSKVTYKNVGIDAAAALAACKKQERLLVAQDSAKAAGAVIVEEKGRISLSKALVRCVQAADDRGSTVAAKAYKLAGEEFLTVIGRRYADEVVTDDFALHQRSLRKRGLDRRTIANRHANVLAFVRFAGVPETVIPKAAPRYEETLPEIYVKQELNAFFSSLPHPHYVVTFSLALKAGLREQELMHVQWSDVDLDRKTLTVRSKPDWGFWVKDREERLLPLPDDLVKALQEYRERFPERLFITGTTGGRPNTHLLRTLKRLVKSADLHCKACAACIASGECANWYLHKFRATYATTLLRSGMDIRTVQKLMGHSDLASTMRYLRPAEDSEIQTRMSSVVW